MTGRPGIGSRGVLSLVLGRSMAGACRAPAVQRVGGQGPPAASGADAAPAFVPPAAPPIVWPDAGEVMPPAPPPPPSGLFPHPFGGSFVDPGLGGDPSGMFGGPAASAGAPRIVYPLDGSMHPVNIFQITIQWSRGASRAPLFRLRFENQAGRYDVFTPCAPAAADPDQCIYPLPDKIISCQEDEKCGDSAVCKNGACVPIVIQ
jgi:hypothetical protein